MTGHFIGAGPGDPDLLTIRARNLIASCPVCLYAGSLVPEAVVAHAPQNARVLDTAPMTLDQIGARFGLTRERVRQIKEKALHRLRHPSRCDQLRTYSKI